MVDNSIDTHTQHTTNRKEACRWDWRSSSSRWYWAGCWAAPTHSSTRGSAGAPTICHQSNTLCATMERMMSTQAANDTHTHMHVDLPNNGHGPTVKLPLGGIVPTITTPTTIASVYTAHRQCTSTRTSSTRINAKVHGILAWRRQLLVILHNTHACRWTWPHTDDADDDVRTGGLGLLLSVILPHEPVISRPSISLSVLNHDTITHNKQTNTVFYTPINRWI